MGAIRDETRARDRARPRFSGRSPVSRWRDVPGPAARGAHAASGGDL